MRIGRIYSIDACFEPVYGCLCFFRQKIFGNDWESDKRPFGLYQSGPFVPLVVSGKT